MHQIEQLSEDGFALAEFLGLGRESAIRAGATTLQHAQECAASGLMEPSAVDHVRWHMVEGMLWEAAQSEKWRRWEESRRGKRFIGTSVGIGWSQAKMITKSVDIKWRSTLFDLFEQPAVSSAMDPDLYSVIYDILKAQHDYQQELEALRSNPDPGKLKALREAAETGKPSAAIADALARLRSFVQRTKQAGVSETTSSAASNPRKDMAGGAPTAAKLQERMKKLRQRYPNERGKAVKEFCDMDPGYSPQYARKVATAIGWDGPRKAKKTKLSG